MKKIFVFIFGLAMITLVSYAEIMSVVSVPILVIQNFQNWWAAGNDYDYEVQWTTYDMSDEYDWVFIQFISEDGKYMLARDVKNNGKSTLEPIRRRVYDLEGKVLTDGGYILMVCAYKTKDMSESVCDTRGPLEINYEG
jgi:hypothetical protein